MKKSRITYEDIPTTSMAAENPRPAGTQTAGEAGAPRAWKGMPGRRGVLMGVLAVGSGFALNVISALPPARLRSASANHSPYSIWMDTRCAGRNYSRQPCANSRTSSGFCASRNWHRHDQIPAGGGRTKVHWVDHERCYGRNAWHWRLSNGQIWRCSDGGFKYIRNGQLVDGPYTSVCPARAG